MTVTRYQDLPLADHDRKWDSAAADKRVRAWADAEHEPDAAYRDAHLWYDGDKPQDFGSYKLPIADVVDGRLVAVPHAIMAVASVLDGGRGGVDIPAEDKKGVKEQVSRYYAKMGEKAPWDR
ncbi:hypothetical protein GCM10027589_44190 [Actinocorallia lasiicapitis]